MACFADINASHDSVATYARCGGIFNIHLGPNYSGTYKFAKESSNEFLIG